MRKATYLISLLLLLFSCKPDSNSTEKPIISVSIPPQQYFLEQLAGDLVEVSVLIPPGASPATYEPTASQLGKLDQSSLYMTMGYLGFELTWLSKIRSVNPEMKIVDLSTGIEPILEKEDHPEEQGHTHGYYDPHLWMSALNAKIIAKNIYNELLLQFPDENDKLTERFVQLDSHLDSLHFTISQLLSSQKDKSFLIYHPALSYFARDYQLVQYPLEIGGKTPSPAHLKQMSDLGNDQRIPIILIQKQFDRNNAQVLANEIGAKIVQIDPLDPDWYKQMIYIATQLSSSL